MDGDTATLAPIYLQRVFCYFCFCDSVFFSEVAHCSCPFFPEHLERTRRYSISRVWGSSDSRGVTYCHRKPQKLAVFCGAPIPEKLEKGVCLAFLWRVLPLFCLCCAFFCFVPDLFDFLSLFLLAVSPSFFRKEQANNVCCKGE